MLLFVGLGNPTPDSQNNRHNIGFKVIDAINQKFGLSKQKPKFKGLLTTGNIGDKKVYAIKPLTFMMSPFCRELSVVVLAVVVDPPRT